MTGIILTSIAVLLLLALGIYALGKPRTGANALLFSVLVLLAGIEVFDQLLLQTSNDSEAFRQISLFFEALLPASFIFLSIFYGRNKPFESQSWIRILFMAALSLFPLALLIIAGADLSYSPDFQNDRMLFLGEEGYWYYIGIMVALVFSLMNIEATLSANHGIDLNRMKFEAIGIMSLLAVLIFYYSQGLLYRSINMNLVPIRSIIFIIAALLIFYSKAFRGIGTRVSISRHVFYRSITLMAVGLYLISLGIVGEGMRYFGVAFSRDLTIFLAFVGGILLLAIFLSEKMRRRTKVFINKYFFVNKHDYREEWIKFTSRLSSCLTLDDVQVSILKVYQETFGLAGASLYILSRDGKRYLRVAEHAMAKSPPELRISEDLLTYLSKRERVLDLTDGEYPLSASELGVFMQGGTWLIVPLISGGSIHGLVVLRGQIVPEKLTYDDYDLMKVLARQAAQAITNRRLSEEVMDMRAMAAVSRISTFVVHDLKNLTSGLSLVVGNAEEHISNPDFQRDAIQTIKKTLIKMEGLTQRLKSIPEKLSHGTQVTDLGRLARDTVAEISKIRGGDIQIEYGGVSVFSQIDEEEIIKVIVNLIQNALNASSEKSSVTVTTSVERGSACIQVSDSGTGIEPDFLKNQLFKPFRTTKETGLGIGLYQCKQIVEAHEGNIEVTSEIGKGTVFTIHLPLAVSNR
jgi:putative PEP-CTERM system histidine kinase